MSTENIDIESLKKEPKTKKVSKKNTTKKEITKKEATEKKAVKAKKATKNKTVKSKSKKKAVEKKIAKSEIVEPKVLGKNSSQSSSSDQFLSDQFPAEQVEKNKALTEKVWKWGGLGLLVLAIYLSAMVSSIKNVLFDTEGIATIVASEIDTSLPNHFATFETGLIESAPENTKSLVSNITKLLPELSSVAKEKINSVVDIMPVFKEELNETIKVYFAENQEDMKSFVETHSEEEFANYFMDDLLATVSLSIDEKLKSEGGLESVKSLSLDRLIKLNSHLGYLAEKNRFELTEQEQLQRRAIVSWTKLLQNL